MAMTGTTSPLELAWTIGGVVGLVFTVWLLLSSWWDYRSLRRLIDAVPPMARDLGPRWWTVAKAAGLWLGCLYLWLVFVGVGLLAIHYPPPPPNTEQQVSSQVFGWLLLSAEFALVAAQAWYLFAQDRSEKAERWLAGATEQQTDRMEATIVNTNERLRRAHIGDPESEP